MLALELWFLIFAITLFVGAAAVVAYDVYMASRLRWLLKRTSSRRGRGKRAWQAA